MRKLNACNIDIYLWCIHHLKLKVEIYSMISSLKTYHPTSHFKPWSLDVHLCAISTPRRAYSLAAISEHTYCTQCHLCTTRYSFSPESSEAFEDEVHAGSDIGKAPRLNNCAMSRSISRYFFYNILFILKALFSIYLPVIISHYTNN